MEIRLMSLRLQTAAVCVAAVLAAACGGGGKTPAESASSPGTPEPPPALPGESTISGRVVLDGKAPDARLIKASAADALCTADGGMIKSELIVVGAGNSLENVFVYVKDGLGDRTFTSPKTPVVLDQSGCRYLPHVFGVQVGQPVHIVNSDATQHNVHAVPKGGNSEFNLMQVVKGQRDVRTFDTPEIMVPFKCDVHGWMNSYAGVVAHPFFAVSKDGGAFEIKGLPAGTYTIEAWHETLGTQTQKVMVDGKAGATADFTFAVK
jgi:plastocyanin